MQVLVPAKRVELDYTNYRGERKTYVVETLALWFGSTAYHFDEQWFISANTDNGPRGFAYKDIHGWRVL